VTSDRQTTFDTARALIAMVAASPVGGRSRDASDKVIAAAYVKGYRRFASILRLAEAGRAEEAMILTRSLLSMAMRAAYLLHDDPVERRRRYLQFELRHLEDQHRLVEEFEALGVAVPDDDRQWLINKRDKLERAVATDLGGKSLGRWPTDRDLFRQQVGGAHAFYPVVYMPGSDVAHFSLSSASIELARGSELELEASYPEAAESALEFAITCYGMLLHLSEASLHHDLGQQALELLSLNGGTGYAGGSA
jgi:hypothetical protein